MKHNCFLSCSHIFILWEGGRTQSFLFLSSIYLSNPIKFVHAIEGLSKNYDANRVLRCYSETQNSELPSNVLEIRLCMPLFLIFPSNLAAFLWFNKVSTFRFLFNLSMFCFGDKEQLCEPWVMVLVNRG